VNVTIYARLSLDRTGEGLGVDRQVEDCRALCESRGWTVREVITDNDLSATSGVRRPGFERLLASSPEAIVVWHTDRLIRLTRDLERVIELGIDVHAVTAGHIDLSTPAGRAVARTVTAWATYEGEQKALRQRAAHRQRATSGKPWWTHRPFGFERDGSHHQDEAPALLSAYERLLTGIPLRQLAIDLNAQGFTTNRGGAWTPVALRRVLLSPRNAGIAEHHGEEIGRGNWEGIVTETQLRAAQRLLTSPSRRTGGGGVRRYLLSGLIFCARCDSPGKVGRRYIDKAKTNTYPVYTCGSSKGCVTHRVTWIDELVGTHVVERLKLPDAEKVWDVDESGIDAARSDVVELEDRLAALSEDYAEGLITRDQLRSGSVRLRERLESARATLAKAESSSAVSGLLGAARAQDEWDALPDVERRAIIEVLIRRIDLNPRGRGVRAQRVTDATVLWHERKEAPIREG
jgi:DNA invertase Pin-like site-specific DNA recombinase